MSKIGNWLSSLRTESVKPDNNDKSKDTATNPTSEEKPQMTEMPDIPLGRDLVKPPVKEKTDSESYNNILLGIAELVVCKSRRDVKNVKNMIEKHPDVIEMLRQPKDANGEDLLTPNDICGIIISCKEALRKNPDKVLAVLSNPEELESLRNTPKGKRCIGVYRGVTDPLDSTKAINPEAFEKQEPQTPYEKMLKDLSFPEKFDKKEFEKWAEDSGLTLRKSPFGYEMVNEDDEIVRTLSVDEKTGKILSDKISKFDDVNGFETARFTKVGISKDITVALLDSKGSVDSVATIKPDGRWYGCDNEPLKYNPLTHEKQ